MKLLFKISMIVFSFGVLLTSAQAVRIEEFKGLPFDDVCSRLINQTALEIGGNKYEVMQKSSQLFSSLYDKEIPTNPCYPSGLGPHRITAEQIAFLPQSVRFFLADVRVDKTEKFVALIYASNDNPDWEMGYMMTPTRRYFSENPSHKYWDEVPNPDRDGCLYSVNFLLQKLN